MTKDKLIKKQALDFISREGLANESLLVGSRTRPIYLEDLLIKWTKFYEISSLKSGIEKESEHKLSAEEFLKKKLNCFILHDPTVISDLIKLMTEFAEQK